MGSLFAENSIGSIGKVDGESALRLYSCWNEAINCLNTGLLGSEELERELGRVKDPRLLTNQELAQLGILRDVAIDHLEMIYFE